MYIRLLVLTALIWALCDSSGETADPGSKPSDAAVKKNAGKTREQHYQRLRNQLDQAASGFWEKQLEAAGPQLFAFVEAEPKSELARGMLDYLISSPAPEEGAFKQKVWRLIAERYAANEEARTYVYSAKSNPQAGRQMLERIVAVNPDPTLKATALLSLAHMVFDQLEKTSDPEKQKPLTREVEAILDRVTREFGTLDLRPFLASQRADELRNRLALRIGQPFPDLEGSLVTGAKEHISAYRGKVVVFDVWATWCGPCKAMIPHEREMVEKHKGQPLAVISLSIDNDKDQLDKFLKKTPMPWVQWWEKGIAPKIGRNLALASIPAIFVVDTKGVLRYKNVRGDDLTKAVETCLAEIKK